MVKPTIVMEPGESNESLTQKAVKALKEVGRPALAKEMKKQLDEAKNEDEFMELLQQYVWVGFR